MAPAPGRVRVLRLVAASFCALALVAIGVRYLWLRDQRRATEHTVATLTAKTSDALRLLRSVQATRRDATRNNATVQAERDRVRTIAATMHAELSRTRADTATAAVDAYVSAVEANHLRDCLTGVSQALNQLAVGDVGLIVSLRAVEAPCRAAGIT